MIRIKIKKLPNKIKLLHKKRLTRKKRINKGTS